MTRFKFQADTIKYKLFEKTLTINLVNNTMEARKDDNKELDKTIFTKKSDGTQVEPKNIKKIILEISGGKKKKQIYKIALATVLKMENAVATSRHHWFKQDPHKITKDGESWVTIQGIKTSVDNKYEIDGAGETLTLKEADFTEFEAKKILRICNYDNTADKEVCKDDHENVEEAVNKLVDITDALNDASFKYHKEKNFTNINIEKSISDLETYWLKANSDNNSLENAIINLDTSGGLIEDNNGNNMCKSLDLSIRWYLHRLNELKVWKDVVGLDNIDDVLRANANGFAISSRVENPDGTVNLKGDVTVGEGFKNNGSTGVSTGNTGKLNPQSSSAGAKKNIDAIKAFFDKGRLYRGFSIIDPEQKIAKKDAEWTAAGGAGGSVPNDDHLWIDYHGTAVPSKHFTKQKIDNFRKLWDKDTDIDFKKTRGFRPGDIKTGATATAASTEPGNHDIFDGATKYDVAADYDKTTGNTTGTPVTVGTNGSITRKCFEILDISKGTSATKMDDIVKLIFLENDFDEVDVYDKDKVGKEAHTTAITRKDLLELYEKFSATPAVSNGIFTGTKNFDEAMKDKIMIGKNPALRTGDAETREKEIERLEKCHNHAADFINAYFKTYSESDGKEELEKAINCLNGFRLDGGDNDKKTFWTFWKDKVAQKTAEIQKIINDIDDKNRKLSKDNEKELNKLISTEEGNAKAKAVYQAFNALELEDDKKSDGVFEALRKLIAELKKNEPSLAELEKYSKGSGDDKTAWDFVNGVAGAKEGQKGWADWKLEQITKILTDARNATKAVMTDESGAAEAIEVDQQTDIDILTNIKELFEKCKKAHQKEGDMANLKTELTGFRDDTGNKKKAWDLVNKYKKSGESKGYAESALEKATQTNDKAKKTFDELLLLADVNTIRTEWEKSDKSFLAEEDMKRAQAVKLLESKSDAEAKELAELLKKNSTDFYTDDDSDDGLEKIKTDIEKLIKYKEASDDETKGKALKLLEEIDKLGGSKAFLDNWIEKLEARKAILETKQQERNKNNNNEPHKSHLEKYWVWYVLICVLFIVAIGAAFYFFWGDKPSEEE